MLTLDAEAEGYAHTRRCRRLCHFACQDAQPCHSNFSTTSSACVSLTVLSYLSTNKLTIWKVHRTRHQTQRLAHTPMHRDISWRRSCFEYKQLPRLNPTQYIEAHKRLTSSKNAIVRDFTKRNPFFSCFLDTGLFCVVAAIEPFLSSSKSLIHVQQTFCKVAN